MTAETCRLCTDPELILPGDDLPLCRRHWNGWLDQFVGPLADEPPCAAHLVAEPTSTPDPTSLGCPASLPPRSVSGGAALPTKEGGPS